MKGFIRRWGVPAALTIAFVATAPFLEERWMLATASAIWAWTTTVWSMRNRAGRRTNG